MPLELLVLSGARNGQRQTYDKSLIAIGRHPLSDFRFDPEADRDVSSRHAEIQAAGDRWMLRDSNSTNGTYVNGRRIAEHELRDGDVVAFGEKGPKVEIHLSSVARATAPSAISAPPPTAVERSLRSAAGSSSAPISARNTTTGPGPQNTTERVALAVRQQTRGLKVALVVALGLVIVGGGAALWLGRQQTSEIRSLLAKTDSLAHEGEQQRGKMVGLDSARAIELLRADQLKLRVAQGGVTGEAAATELQQSLNKQAGMLRAGSLDYTAISATSGKAVALIFVEMPDGKSYSGTGFCIASSGVIVTNRHLVQNPDGQQPKRIVVVFSDTKVGLAAKVVHVASDPDLAVLQLTEGSRHPVVRGLANGRNTVVAGAPVAIIGYPLGLDTPMDQKGEEITARSTLGAGILSKTLVNVLQIDAYAGEGSSGSPVFDANGMVIGVVYGGAAEASGRIVYAVPLEKLKAELAAAGVK